MAVPLPKYEPIILATVYLTGVTYRHATEDFYDGSDNYFKGSLIEDPELTSQLSDLYYGVETSTSITLKFANRDNGIDDTWDQIVITNAKELRGRWVLIQRYDPTDGTTFEFRGKITSYKLGSVVEITVEMRDDDILEVLLPLDVVTNDAPFTATALDVGEPINIPFGHCRNVPLPNIQNNTGANQYDYLIGYGTIESLWISHANDIGVKRDGVLVDTTEYTFDDGSGAPTDHGYAGYATIRFAKEQMDFTGNFHKLTADVYGLELGGATAERNFATVIKNILTNATWGLSDNADAASFTAADTALDTIGNMYCDGVVTKQRKARDIINDLLFPARARIWRATDGEWEIDIDDGGASVLNLGENDGYYDNCEVLEASSVISTEALKTAIVHYSLDPSNEEIPFKELNVSAHSGFGVDRTYDLPFVMEDNTAIRVLSYLKNRSIYSDKTVVIRGGMECRDLSIGQIVTLTSSLRVISAKEYMIENIAKSLSSFQLECREYSASIYGNEAIGAPTGPTGRDYVVYGPQTWVGDITLGDAVALHPGQVTLVVAAGQGDTYIAAGKTDFTNAQNGFIFGIDDSDADLAKAYIGDADSYYNWDGAKLIVKGLVEIIGNPALQNMLMNGGYEETDGTNAYYWTSGAGIETIVVGGDDSNNYLKLTRTGADKISYQENPDASWHYFEVNEGETYELGGSVKTDGACSYYMRVTAIDKDKANSTNVAASSGIVVAWTSVSNTYTVLAGKKFLRILVAAITANGWAAFDNVYLKRVDEKAWSFTHASDRTKIDGGDMYVGSSILVGTGVTAGSIAINDATFGNAGIQLIWVNDAGWKAKFHAGDGANEYFKYIQGTGVSISTAQANAITIKSGGDIKLEDGGDINLEAGGDITLTGDNSDPGLIVFLGNTHEISLGANVSGTGMDIIPGTDNASGLDIGCTDSSVMYGVAEKRWLAIKLVAAVSYQSLCKYDANIYSQVYHNAAVDYAQCWLYTRWAGDAYYVKMYADAADKFFGPGATNLIDLGLTGSRWKDGYFAGTADIDGLILDGKVTRHLDLGPASFVKHGASVPTQDTEGVYVTEDFQPGSEQSVWYVMNVPYRWDTTTDMEVHFFWLVDANAPDAAKFVRWGVQYKATKATEAVAGAGTSFTQDVASLDVGNYTAGTLIDTTMTTKILGSALEAHDQLAFRFYRDGANDDLNDEARLVEIHVEFTQMRLGLAI